MKWKYDRAGNAYLSTYPYPLLPFIVFYFLLFYPLFFFLVFFS